MTQQTRRSEAVALHGHRAGFASRVVAASIDVATVALLQLACLLVAGLVRHLLVGPPFALPALPQWLAGVAGGGIAIAYLTSCWAIAGRTVGMQVLGLRLVGRRSGRPPRPAAALLRAVLCLVFPLGLLWILVSRRNASLQDLVVGSAVIYDWSYWSIDTAPGGTTA